MNHYVNIILPNLQLTMELVVNKTNYSIYYNKNESSLFCRNKAVFGVFLNFPTIPLFMPPPPHQAPPSSAMSGLWPGDQWHR